MCNQNNNVRTAEAGEVQTCPAVGYQSASVCVPVTVTPFAEAGSTTTKCCGDPIVTPGRETCDGVKNGSCFFTISQNICVAVPVAFGAVATVGVRWGTATSAATALPARISAPAATASSLCPPSPSPSRMSRPNARAAGPAF